MAQHRRAPCSPLALGLALALGVAACSESHGIGGDDAGAGTDAARDGGVCACVDAAFPHDGGAPASCAAEDARAMVCPGAICDGLDAYAWDGERCVTIACGTCVGADCGALPRSLEACEAAHRGCEPALCRASGGEWLFWAEECEHRRCGQPGLAICEVGMPVCDCGVGRSFDPTLGCVDDPSCGEVDPLPPDALCASTGGTWTEGICCPTRCGRFCDAECLAPACVCGELEIFDPVRGCIDAAECRGARSVGETCGEGVRCADGLLCCQRCGGAGCDPVQTCLAPVCDDDPTIDECGNDLLAP